MSAPDAIDFGKEGLVPTVAQDALSGEVLIVAFADREAFERTLASGEAHFFSRSRGRIWRKGEESGNTLAVREVRYDCDADALLYLVDPAGPACHTGARSCFFRAVGRGGSPDRPAGGASSVVGAGVVAEVARVVESRKRERPQGSYVAGLLEKGPGAVREKVTEEALEVVQASKRDDLENLVHEVADVWFQTLVLLAAHGVPVERVFAELARRRR